MFNKQILFLVLIALWVAEPFLSLTALRGQAHRVSSAYGIEAMGGDVCCSVDSKGLCHDPRHGYYPAGCTPDSARNLFFSQGAVKFMPPVQPVLFRLDLRRAVVAEDHFLPVVPSSISTPPPKLDHFA